MLKSGKMYVSDEKITFQTLKHTFNAQNNIYFFIYDMLKSFINISDISDTLKREVFFCFSHYKKIVFSHDKKRGIIRIYRNPKKTLKIILLHDTRV